MQNHTAPVSTKLKTLNITVENLSPPQGNVLMPLWFGFHDGNFTIFKSGDPASPALERLAEDGNTGPLTSQFSQLEAGIVQGTVFGTDDIFNSIFPGSTVSLKIVIDVSLPSSRFFSYAAMVVPSNDAFISNENSKAHEIVDSCGKFARVDITVMGSEVFDAGTEVNDEAPLHAAGAGPVFTFDAGVAEKGVVHRHKGYQPGGTILSNPTWANADFTVPDYRVARITVTEA
jgi:hypothetical protein